MNHHDNVIAAGSSDQQRLIPGKTFLGIRGEISLIQSNNLDYGGQSTRHLYVSSMLCLGFSIEFFKDQLNCHAQYCRININYENRPAAY